jgi:hypothetical protein
LGIRAVAHYRNDPSRYEGSFIDKVKTLAGDFQEDVTKVVRIVHVISAIYAPAVLNMFRNP